MTPPLATFICILFILSLFRIERHNNQSRVSRAIWIPTLWMFLAGSRYASHWLNTLGIRTSSISSPDAYMEGSPLDMPVFLFLIAASIIILIRRRLKWGELLSNNYIASLFYIFALISILWSDYPIIALKRWTKSFGAVCLALVILTEECPYAAFGVIMKRLAFLLLPLSILFIKYYPDIGRQYHSTGSQMLTGVAMQKNELGQLCMLSGIYFCWNLFYVNRQGTCLDRRLHSFIYWAVLSMIAWLLYMADSATSLVCLVVSICLFLVGRWPIMVHEPRRIMTFCIACIVLYGIMQLTFDINAIMITMLDRRPDLTTRVPMWEDLRTMAKNPFFGFGWQSFLLGGREELMLERWHVRSTHNAYLDLYLNLGIIGLVLLIGWILAGLRKVWHHLTVDYHTALLRVCLILVFILYNWTETTDYGVSNTYIIFLLGTMDPPMAIRES